MNRDIEIKDMVGAFAICDICQSSDVLRDASAIWNGAKGCWVISELFDTFFCNSCCEECSPKWQLDEDFRVKEIARLNDAIRRGNGGEFTIVVTNGVKSLTEEQKTDIFRKVVEFDDFSEDNDPHGEHDFGCVHCGDVKVFWKIDHFGVDLKQYSPDPASEILTHRVLTIMLANEY